MSDVINLTVNELVETFKVTLTDEQKITVNFYNVALPDSRVYDALTAAQAAQASAEAAAAAATTAGQQAVQDAFASKTTTDLAEGANLYYTPARFNSAFSAKTTTNLAEGTNLYYSQARFDTAFSAKTTDSLPQGTTNRYYATSLFTIDFMNKTTDNLSEGVVNKYYMDSRARTAVVLNTLNGTQIDQAPSVSAVKSYVSANANTAETLTNKTLTAPIINNSTTTNASIVTPSRLDVKQGTKTALTTYALTASNGQIVFATDEKKMYQIVDTKLVSIGGGTGSLDTILQLQADETISEWATGNNTLYVTNPPLEGTFVFNTTSPLQGSQDYKYTQVGTSLNDFMLSPIKPVDVRFRGRAATLFFPYKYNGNDNDIQVIFFDATNSAVIPSSIFLPASTTVGMFRTNITIPSTCANIQVGFQVKVANSAKVFQFDSVQLSADTTVMAPIASITNWQTFTPTWSSSGTQPSVGNGTLVGAWRRIGDTVEVFTELYSGSTTTYGTGAYSFSMPPGLTIDATKVSTSGDRTVLGVSSLFGSRPYNADVTYNGGASQQVSASLHVSATSGARIGQTYPETWTNVGNVNSFSLSYKYPVVGWSATNPNILTAPDTFSTDTAALTYSSTYTLSTLANAPVGTFITFTYAANTNTRTQTTTAPTQTTSDMNQNGILLYTRAYNAASTAAQPTAMAIQIGKGMKGKSLDLYKSVGKATSGSLDYVCIGATDFGAHLKDYNEVTGILYVDAGLKINSANTSANFRFNDVTDQAFGYLTISASKNPALTGLNISAVAARGVSTSGQSIPNNAGTTVVWNATKTFDTHGALNTSTGVYTVPETGYYHISASVFYSNTTWAGSSIVQAYILVNGAQMGLTQDAGTPTNYAITRSVQVSDILFLKQNDTVSVATYQNTGAAVPLNTGNNLSYFAIAKTNVG